MRAWSAVPAANNALADREAARVMVERGILHVPDLVASAGAVIEGIGRTVMNLSVADRGRLVDRLGDVAGEILDRAAASGTSATEVAESIARDRLAKFV
jgi:leucine dehydrogenase